MADLGIQEAYQLALEKAGDHNHLIGVFTMCVMLKYADEVRLLMSKGFSVVWS